MGLATSERPGSAPSGGTQAPVAAMGVTVGLRLLAIGPFLVLLILIGVISLLTPNFLKPINISNIVAQTAVIAIVAVGQHLVILTRGIDLSVGANLALASVVGGLLFRITDSAPLVIIVIVLAGGAVGAFNGLV